MEVFIIGLIVAANIIFIIYKFTKGRFPDAILDSILLGAVTVVFMGSYAGLVVGTIASLCVSIYLYYNPPTLGNSILNNSTLASSITQDDVNNFFTEFKKRSQRRYHD